MDNIDADNIGGGNSFSYRYRKCRCVRYFLKRNYTFRNGNDADNSYNLRSGIADNSSSDRGVRKIKAANNYGNA